MLKLESDDETKLKDWFDVQRQNGLVDFKVDINKHALAKTFGGEVVWRYDARGFPTESIVWPEGTDTDAINRHIQREMVRVIDAMQDPTKTRVIKHDKDDFGNVTDEAHPDYQEESARLEHVNLMRKSFPTGELISNYELEFVGRGLIDPIPGLDYGERFEKKISWIETRYSELEMQYMDLAKQSGSVRDAEMKEVERRLDKIEEAFDRLQVS